jgi:hypothetical protein
MALTLRFTAPSSDYRDWLDYTIVEDGRRDVGRLYEDRHTRPELRWLWSITVYINPNLGISTSGRAPTINEAKEHFLRNWQKCRTVSSLARRPGDPVGRYSHSTSRNAEGLSMPERMAAASGRELKQGGRTGSGCVILTPTIKESAGLEDGLRFARRGAGQTKKERALAVAGAD